MNEKIGIFPPDAIAEENKLKAIVEALKIQKIAEMEAKKTKETAAVEATRVKENAETIAKSLKDAAEIIAENLKLSADAITKQQLQLFVDNALFHAIFNSITDGIIVTDINGNILFYNQAALNITG